MRTPFGGNEALGLAVRTPCIPITAYHFLGITTITAYVLLRKPKGACEAEGLRSSTGLLTIFPALPSTPKGSMVQQAPSVCEAVRMQ